MLHFSHLHPLTIMPDNSPTPIFIRVREAVVFNPRILFLHIPYWHYPHISQDPPTICGPFRPKSSDGSFRCPDSALVSRPSRNQDKTCPVRWILRSNAYSGIHDNISGSNPTSHTSFVSPHLRPHNGSTILLRTIYGYPYCKMSPRGRQYGAVDQSLTIHCMLLSYI
jgi:hypothetical protein